MAGWFGAGQPCNCCSPKCPLKFYVLCCHLFWYIEPGDVPVGDYTVTIITPSGTEYYSNVSSGVFENAELGTYAGFTTVDAVDSIMCGIEVVECTDDPCNCCVRVDGIHTKITRSASTFKATGAWYFPSLGWAGQYAEGSVPDFSHERLSDGYMSSGSKTDSNCYTWWGFPGASDFLDVPLGSGHVDFYTGIRAYRFDPIGTRPAVLCSVPTADYYYQRIYYDYYLKYTGWSDGNGPNVRFWATRTAEDYSSNGSPLGDAPAIPTLPSDVALSDVFNLYDVCPDYHAIVHTLYGLISLQTGVFQSIQVCDGSLDFVIERWPNVIPL